MHELAIVRALIEQAQAAAQEHGAARITCIHCRIGALRQVAASSLRAAFDLARVGTPLADAVLEVTHVGTTLECRGCGTRRTLAGWAFECPQCGSSDVVLTGGDELELTSMELEVNDED